MKKVLFSVLTIASLFVLMVSPGWAQVSETINFENLSPGDNVFDNTPFISSGGQPPQAGGIEPLVGGPTGNPGDLASYYYDGESGGSGGYVELNWDFQEPSDGTGTISWVWDNTGHNQEVEFRTEIGGDNSGNRFGWNGPDNGFGDATAGSWAGVDTFDETRPVTQSIELTWVGGSSAGQPYTYTVSQDGNVGFVNSGVTGGLNAGSLYMFFDRRGGPQPDMDALSFIIPEPGSLTLLFMGLPGLGLTRIRSRRRR